jgi:hypothetical protein
MAALRNADMICFGEFRAGLELLFLCSVCVVTLVKESQSIFRVQINLVLSLANACPANALQIIRISIQWPQCFQRAFSFKQHALISSNQCTSAVATDIIVR